MTSSRAVILEDAALPAIWYELPELCGRIPNTPWHAEYVTVPIAALLSYYHEPGGGNGHGGFMTASGLESNKYFGRPIVELAAVVKEALKKGTADTANPSIKKIEFFLGVGVDGIKKVDEPMAYVRYGNCWFVREGMHRSVSLAILGVSEWEALNMTSLRQ